MYWQNVDDTEGCKPLRNLLKIFPDPKPHHRNKPMLNICEATFLIYSFAQTLTLNDSDT